MDIKHIKTPILKPTPFLSRKDKITVIAAVSLGNLLEWYEIYLYVYWAPTFAKLFFHSTDNLNLIYTYLIFSIGFLARPLGGLFFGRIGDKLGRKKSMILSILIMIVPTFIIGLLPTYAQIGVFAPIILTLMRLLQAFPAGGELPGAMCYLYESAEPHKRKFMSSWGACGFQLGILVSTIECFILERSLSPQSLLQWGWRLSFLLGGLIGFLGLYLRHKLHETPLFKDITSHGQVVKKNLLQVLYKYKKAIFTGVLFCTLNSASFYWLSINVSMSFEAIFGTSYEHNLILTCILLLFITIPLPFFGMLADHYSVKKMLIYSTIGTIILIYPLHMSIHHASLKGMVISIALFCLLFTCISALIPYILCDLFPTYVRFTCTAFSFNLVDALIGGFTPTIALCLLRFTGNQNSFCWFLLLCALISLIAYCQIPAKKDFIHNPPT
ncbi:MAG: MFS transporter [Chlamydiota bacterium]